MKISIVVSGRRGFATAGFLFLIVTACSRSVKSSHELAPSPFDRPLVTPQHSGCTDPEIARVGGVDTVPILLKRVEPVFSWSADAPPIRGIVIVEAIVDRDGNVCSAAVVKPLRPDVDAAAIAAVKQFRFRPATRKGSPVQAAYYITVNVVGPR